MQLRGTPQQALEGPTVLTYTAYDTHFIVHLPLVGVWFFKKPTYVTRKEGAMHGPLAHSYTHGD